MSFFGNLLTNMDKLEQDYLGPDYGYYKKISSPGELGMSGKGSMGALSSDIAGIVDYVKVLVSGSGRASKTGKPLGDRYFIQTGGQCKDYKTNKLVTRSMYIDNVPSSDIPFISDVTGVEFPEFRGIIPGIMDDLDAINPLKMFRAFTEGSEPACAEVTLPTIDQNDVQGTGSGFIPIVELMDLESDGKISGGTVTTAMKNALNASSTSNNVNTSNNSNDANKETFLNMCDSILGNKVSDISDISNIKRLDNISNVYMISFSLLLMYITYRMLQK